ncbi:MAG: hypothetical protein GY940_29265, partial [bacterium]|nr:hypothetical protein [bacterium]
MKTKRKFPGPNRVTVLIISCFLMLTVWSISGVNASPVPQEETQQPDQTGQTADNPKTEDNPKTADNPKTEDKTSQTEKKKAKEPTFTVPKFTFKGAELNREKIGDFDKIYIDGKEITDKKIIVPSTGKVEVKLVKNNKEYTRSVFVIPGIFTLLPPLVAILLALLFKDVMLSLFIGIFTGAFFLTGYDPFTAFF